MVRSRFEWSVLILAVLLGGGAWTLVSRVPADESAPAGLPPAPRIGFAAPDFTADTLDGTPVHLAALRGKPVVLNFWATWCPPCRQELPHLRAAAAAAGERVVFVGVDDQEPLPIVSDFVQSVGLGYRIALDPAGAISGLYRVDGLPTTFFVDRDGIVRDMTIGPLTAAALEDKLQALGVTP